ncbi:glycosyltransferase family 4 protein [Rhodococcoides corynebacterioides]|uniref:Glycosyltransferase family 4 protein n=1 Tax=Rhodococcoides corynebacterioides TaxID=53972 RepID=A0ABS7P604_9NOCA|nr:glycosyltransferase family 4 protein [Rhodococcus corynebacterioides]MBY6367780.1 glycosyltransferase family 4 protein [Rhodococcus corynebacterioides]MBY6407231.1 glycosyltransferase family 4 protein [Rhodococcus corynebacterioides]
MREVLLLCWRDTGHPQGGGSERYLEHVGAGLAAQGVAVTLRTAAYPGAPRTEMRDGVRISRAGGRLTVYPRALAAIVAGRWGVGPLAGMRPDAVVDTQNGIPFFARLVTRAPVTVLVHHCHREQWPVAGRVMARLGWFLESRVSPRVHRSAQYLTVSLPSADELVALGVDRDRVAVVRNGVDELPAGLATGDAGTRADVPTLAVLSRLVPHKQIEDAIDVVARLRVERPALRLDVVGGGWWEDRLRARARSRGVADAVTFHGHVSERRKHEILSRAWVHVLPSRKEGWGLAVVEAAQHGVPTVGYRHSRGLTDSVVDGVTGALVGDEWLARASDVDELTDAVRDLIDDDRRRRQLGEKARDRAEEFSWAQCADAVASVLRDRADGTVVAGLVTGDPVDRVENRALPTPRSPRPRG